MLLDAFAVFQNHSAVPMHLLQSDGRIRYPVQELAARQLNFLREGAAGQVTIPVLADMAMLLLTLRELLRRQRAWRVLSLGSTEGFNHCAAELLRSFEDESRLYCAAQQTEAAPDNNPVRKDWGIRSCRDLLLPRQAFDLILVGAGIPAAERRAILPELICSIKLQGTYIAFVGAAGEHPVLSGSEAAELMLAENQWVTVGRIGREEYENSYQQTAAGKLEASRKHIRRGMGFLRAAMKRAVHRDWSDAELDELIRRTAELEKNICMLDQELPEAELKFRSNVLKEALLDYRFAVAEKKPFMAKMIEERYRDLLSESAQAGFGSMKNMEEEL